DIEPRQLMSELAKEQEPGAITSEVLPNYDAAEVTDVGACHPATTHRHNTANWTSFPVAAAAVAGYIAVESGPSNRTTDTEGHSSGRLRRHLPTSGDPIRGTRSLLTRRRSGTTAPPSRGSPTSSTDRFRRRRCCGAG